MILVISIDARGKKSTKEYEGLATVRIPEGITLEFEFQVSDPLGQKQSGPCLTLWKQGGELYIETRSGSPDYPHERKVLMMLIALAITEAFREWGDRHGNGGGVQAIAYSYIREIGHPDLQRDLEAACR